MKKSLFALMALCAILVTGCDQFFLSFSKMGAYSLVWEENGGSAVADLSTSLVSTMPISMRPGYALEGWYSDSAFASKVSFPYDPTANTTLYAKWNTASEGLVFSANSTGYNVFNSTALGAIIIPAYWQGKPVTAIESWGFNYGNHTSVIIPSSVTSIGASAFIGSSGFITITLPSALVSIGLDAFNGSALSSITIPAKVTSIESAAFYNCTSLTSVTVEALTPPTIAPDIFYTSTNTIPAGLVIRVPAASLNAYKAAYGWNVYSSNIVSQ